MTRQHRPLRVVRDHRVTRCAANGVVELDADDERRVSEDRAVGRNRANEAGVRGGYCGDDERREHEDGEGARHGFRA
jgi:hypothetical protein